MKYLLLIAAVLLLCSCGEFRGSLPGGSTSAGGQHVGDILCSIGVYALWAGSTAVFVAGLGAIASVVPYTALFVAPFRGYLAELGILGVGAILIGSSFVYVGDHPWIIAVTSAVVALAAAVRYRARWLPLFGISPASPPAVAVKA